MYTQALVNELHEYRVKLCIIRVQYKIMKVKKKQKTNAKIPPNEEKRKLNFHLPGMKILVFRKGIMRNDNRNSFQIFTLLHCLRCFPHSFFRLI